MRLPVSLLAPTLVVACCLVAAGCGRLTDPGVPSAPASDVPAVDADLAGDDADALAYEDEASEPFAWEAGVPAAPEAGALPPAVDATAPPEAAAPGGACGHPPGEGDLQVDELMIESVAGAGDDGEWLEVTNVSGCALDLRGLHGDAPVGSKVHSFDVGAATWVPAAGTFLVADSADPAVNHDLPGLVLTWSGHPGDVLRNEGGTVTLTFGATLVASITWPKLTLSPGTSIELPADCDADRAGDFTAWRPAAASWFPAFFGTPNAPNADVGCPP
ncbi:MAG: hypothetical protein ACRELB_24250 [Polyangiaceae bacterium]